MPTVKKPGPTPKEAPSCGLTKQIYIEQIAAGETNASIERAWGMYSNSLYEWIKRWDLKGLKQESAMDLLGQTADPEEKGKDEQAVRTEEHYDKDAIGLAGINAQRDAERIKALSAKLLDRNAAYDRLLLENKSLNEKLTEERKVVAELTEDRDEWKKIAHVHMEQSVKNQFDLNDARKLITELEADKQLLLETIERETDRAAEKAVAAVPATDQDNVNHPSHYKAGGIETIEFIRAKLTPAEFVGYCKGNVLKYVARANYKGGMEDLSKAAKYLEFATEGTGKR